MEKCNCYITVPNRVYSIIRDNWIPVVETRCRGTKEIDQCGCGGDRTKCSFYPEVREKAKRELKSEIDAMELDFYRDYIMRHGLIWDALKEYQEWRKIHLGKDN